MDNPPSISAVVPVYRSAETLPLLLERLSAALAAITSTWQIILVNDASPDESWAVIESLLPSYPQAIGLNLMRNAGQHAALLAGIRRADYELVVTLDDDLQNPPEEIHRLVSRLCESGADVVYGKPADQQHQRWRTNASQITRLALATVAGAAMARDISAFRVFRTRLRMAFANFTGIYVNIDVLLSWGARRYETVVVQHNQRHAGQSGYSLRKLIRHGLNMVMGFSIWPLRFASLLGFAFTLFGFGVLAYVVGRYLLEGGSVPGFPFTASTIAIFAGVQLFALGIIGEYMARLYIRLMDRPSYVIQDERQHSAP